MKAWIPLVVATASCCWAAQTILLSGERHIRSAEPREWNEFPEKTSGSQLVLSFPGARNAAEQTLRLRHRDVRLGSWIVSINGRELGRLPSDERDMVLMLPVGPEVLAEGANELRIATKETTPDDIAVGDVRLVERPMRTLLREATVEVTVLDRGDKVGLPSKITVADAAGSLFPVGAESDRRLAVSTGAVYTSNGRARFGLPPGDYVVYASRGFEYSADSARISLRAGDVVRKQLAIRREVPVPGYISCDTHIHTRERSGHGDASIQERLLTIAGEGLELAISTEHNQHADYGPPARELGLDRYFTTAVGNEVTTRLGHFNIFPVDPAAPAPDHTLKDWSGLLAGIWKTPGTKVVVLNHPRDNHLGFRPFAPENHNAAAGENRHGWKLEANAMEVVNSGATQSDPLRLYHDWFGLLNRGLKITGVGASDSHTVDYKPVAQARTYIAVEDRDAGRIDAAAAWESLRQGRTMVSFGLLAEILVEERYGPGDLASLAPGAKYVKVKLRVLGPSWSAADHVALYANGVILREARISASNSPGEKWSVTWRTPRPAHDVHLAAIATGPGVRQPFWEIRKPYQPASKDWQPRVIGSTGVVWLDADGDGKFTTAYEYATRLVGARESELSTLMRELGSYDEAVAVQAASLLQARGRSVVEDAVQAALRDAPARVQRGFKAYAESRQ